MSETSLPVIFSTVPEGARKAFGARLTPKLFAELKAVGMDFEGSQAAYPMETFLSAMQVLARGLVPGAPASEQYRLLGREFMKGYVQTALGFAIFSMAKLIGPKRTLTKLSKGFRTTGNYLECDVQDIGPNEVHVATRIKPEFKDRLTDAVPVTSQYRLGVFEGTLEQLGVTGRVEMSRVGEGGLEAHFRISWT